MAAFGNNAAARWMRRIAGVIGFAALVIAGYRGYTTWREQHLAAQLKQFAQRDDFKSAVLVARRLLELDPNSLAAARTMAEMAEKCGRPDAIEWRKKITQLEPTPANQLALARTALRFGQRDVTEAILRKLPNNTRATAEFHELAGAAALAHGDHAQAQTHFAAAAQSAPKNAQLALNLAAVRLVSNDPAWSTQARESLVSLTSDRSVRRDALRALAADALAHKQQRAAQQWTAQLVAENEITFRDLLLRFEAVAGTDEAAPALAELQASAAKSVAATAEVITWLNRHELPQVAVYWASTLPNELADAQPVPLAVAESYSFLQEWPALRTHVEGKNWGDAEALRLAVLSHALHRLNPPDHPSIEAQLAWTHALEAAQSRPAELLIIAQLAEGWGYAAEAEEAWWKIAGGNEQPKSALAALQRIYKARQDTRGMLRVAKRALELNPNDFVAANNCASLALLLNADSTARRLAARLHEEHPANRAFATTYAFALRTEGKLEDALQVMEGLKEEELRYPSIAAYYVVMLVESGDLERAREFLGNAEHASLLPEERQLLQAAARKLGAS